MNGVAPPEPAAACSTAEGRARRTSPAPWRPASSRGPASGRSRRGRGPARVRVQYARWRAASGPSSQAASSATQARYGWAGRPSHGSRPAARASYAASRSRATTAALSPSYTMWWAVITRMSPPGWPVTSRTANSGPSARANGVPWAASTASVSASSVPSMCTTDSGGPSGRRSMTICRTVPSTAATRVRSASCRSARAVTAARSTPGSSVRPARTASLMLRATGLRLVRAAIQIRRWARESGRTAPSGAGASRGTAAGAAGAPSGMPSGCSSTAARARTVCCWKTVTSGTRTPNSSCRAAARRAAVRLWPPRENRSASGSVTGDPSTSAQILATRSSVGFSSAHGSGSSRGGAGSARRSSLPLGFSGSSSIATYVRGTIAAGSSSVRWARRVCGAAAPTT